MAVAGTGASVSAAIVWAALRYRPMRVTVEGASMLPTLLPGDWCLAVAPRRFARGDVVVVEHPERPGYEMVKRVVGGPGDRHGGRLLASGEWWVEGDRPDASTDSRHFGPVGTEALKAKVLLVYGPRGRRRLVR
jgi:nickel-type superoxide dismutase maturation protease